MSAWIVTRAHIDVLVLASVQFAVPFDDATPPATPTPREMASAGAELWAENHRSVDHRYDESGQPLDYAAPTAEVLLDPVAVVKAIDCYAYQSCEHPGWPDSRANRFCRRLRAAAMHSLPVADDATYPGGWDRAPWGVDDLAQAAAGAITDAGSLR